MAQLQEVATEGAVLGRAALEMAMLVKGFCSAQPESKHRAGSH